MKSHDQSPHSSCIADCKRLFFGIHAASEVYDYETQKTLQWIEGVANISDGIISHAANQEEHDKRL